MYCKHCGAYLADDSLFCAHCGKSTDNNQSNNQNAPPPNYNQGQPYYGNQPYYNPTPVNPEHQQSKTGMGVLFALLLGVIGLVVGICLYPEGTYARKTFIKSWVITYAISIVAAIVIAIIASVIIVAVVSSTPHYIYY